MRHAWSECDAGQGGPDEGGILCGWHLYDFGRANPEGHIYAAESQRRNNWGQQGGLGSVFYAGRWYCIETNLRISVSRSIRMPICSAIIASRYDSAAPSP